MFVLFCCSVSLSVDFFLCEKPCTGRVGQGWIDLA